MYILQLGPSTEETFTIYSFISAFKPYIALFQFTSTQKTCASKFVMIDRLESHSHRPQSQHQLPKTWTQMRLNLKTLK